MEKKKVFSMLLLAAMLAGGTALAVECPEQIPDLVSYWKFDDGAGTIAYDAVNNNDGAVQGAQWTAGQIDGALGFDEAGRVNCGHDSSLDMTDGMTLSLWVNPDDSEGGYRRFVVRGTSAANVGLLYKNSLNELHYMVRDGGNEKIIYASASPGVWQHVAATYDSGTMELYVNGQFAGQLTGANLQASVSGHDLLIGGLSTSAPSQWFDGKIDDVAFFNRALTSDEIMGIYLDGAEGLGLGLDHKMAAVNKIKKAIDVKNEAVEAVNAAIIKEQASLAALEALQDCDDPGLTPQAIHVAIQRIKQSLGRQENIKTELQKSIRELNRALWRLGCPQGNCN